MRIIEIRDSDTHALRRAVLRDGDPNRSVEFAEDSHSGAFHLGVSDDEGVIVAVSTWIPRACIEIPQAEAIQLRGMATAAHLQGTGVGGLLFEVGVSRCTADRFDLLWAKARDTALGFYARHGCSVIGSGFIEAETGLPHHIVVRHLSAAAGA
jgi:GNAT superfamily N-acetyltransferase